MKKNFVTGKLLLSISISLICLAIVFCITSCKRTGQPSIPNTPIFNSVAAKEWFYGSFKKSNYFKSSSDSKKLPNWNLGVYKKMSTIELVEFPIVQERTKVLVPSKPGHTEADLTKIAAASQSRLLFVKKGQFISVRQIEYVPDLNCINTTNSNTSNLLISNGIKQFSGQIYIRDWNKNLLKAYSVQSGIIKKRITVYNESLGSKYVIRSSRDGCIPEQVCEFEQFCTQTCYGDYCTPVECGPWENTGNCFPTGNCDPAPGECIDLNSESCLCEILGLGCGSGGASEISSECLELANNPMKMADGVFATSELIQRTENTIDLFKKKVHLQWKCLQGATWSVYSNEEGLIGLEDPTLDKWVWLELNHKNLNFVGHTSGGTVHPKDDIGTPSFVPGTKNVLYAGMDLKFSIEYVPLEKCPLVDIVIKPFTIQYNSNHIFSAKQ